jgi:hypothetical protein
MVSQCITSGKCVDSPNRLYDWMVCGDGGRCGMFEMYKFWSDFAIPAMPRLGVSFALWW